MKNENRQNRRSFLKTNAVLGISALSGGMALTGCSPTEPAKPVSDPVEALRMNYQECLGGPFPDPEPLKPEVREVIPKDGYRIESLTYEVQPGERVPALLLIPDKPSTRNPL
jgi:hypothetical protein